MIHSTPESQFVTRAEHQQLRQETEEGFTKFNLRFDHLTELMIAGDDRLYKKVDELSSRMETRMDGLDARMGGLDARMGGLETRMEGLETKVGGLETRIGSLEKKVGILSDDVGELKVGMRSIIKHLGIKE